MEQVDIRITRLKLVNYIGIYHGMKQEEFEITFPDNGNAFTMFLGQNGSGKTTIISQLHPFAESFDDRKELILEGKEGIKELDIETREHSYKIKIVISPNKKKTCFIEKDGEELNKNGGLRTYEEIIKNEFGATKEFLKIAKIGSNTDNFIKQTPTERKAYISTFVGDVKKYLESFKIAADKHKVENARLNELAKNIARYSKEETIESEIKASAENIKLLEEKIESLIGEIGKLQLNVENSENYLKDYNFDYMKRNELSWNIELKKMENDDLEFKRKFEKSFSIEECEEQVAILTESLNKEKVEYELLKNNLRTNKEKVVEINNNISRHKYNIKGISSDVLDQLEKELNSDYETQSKLDAQLKTSSVNQFISGNEIKIPGMQATFKSFIYFVINNYNDLNSHDIDDNKSNVKMFFENSFINNLKNKINESKESINKTQKEIDSLKSNIANNNANLNKLDILAKRPSECKIDICPFIADALNYINLPEILTEQEIQLKSKEDNLRDDLLVSERIENINNLYKLFKQYFNNMDARNNLVAIYFVRKGKAKIADLLSLPLNELQKLYDDVITDIENAIDLINDYTEINVKIKNNEYKLKTQKELYANEEYFKKEIEILNENVINLNEIVNEESNKYNELIKEINNKEELLSSFKNRVTYLNNYNELCEKIEGNKKDLQDYENAIKELTLYKNNLDEKTKILTEFKSEKEKLTNSINKLNAELSIVKTLKDDEALVNEHFKKTKLIKNSLDPRSGIPLVFIKAYLGRTEAIANELLELALDGKFKIKFKPTADDFYINFFVDGEKKEDITSASQGEIALATISISLALMEQSSSKFNILVLDEIDGNLDKNNRSSFINIINSQVERLGINQVFVISHNDVFDQCPMNLVLLKDNDVNKNNSDYMQNKIIIYDIDGQ